jgi:hypothetical protein
MVAPCQTFFSGVITNSEIRHELISALTLSLHKPQWCITKVERFRPALASGS